ncbi:MAG: isochorismate synthase, partial [Chloroflexi bacterium]|nr:isochorismate synthase [Chloroflexota bacterium]
LTRADGASWLTVNSVAAPDAPVLDAAGAGRAAALLLDASAAAPMPHAAAAPKVEEALSAAEWKAIVAALTREMRGGRVEKVVLARECQLTAERPFDLVGALDRLRNRFPSCFVFAIGRGRQCFMGATPERLVRLRDGMVSTMCLAGSIARGTTEDEDRRLGEALLNSEKDRAEHAVVVRTLRGMLGELCDDLAPVDTPVLLKVSNIQHLLTTMVGRVAGDRTILDLVERLHPTPASGGAPRETALRLIRERERMDRGWYAGPVGWLDTRGEGEFAVALRSALVRQEQAFLFAGCGIVAHSDPEREFEESCWKLRPMLAALGGAGA